MQNHDREDAGGHSGQCNVHHPVGRLCEVWETRNVPDEEHVGITREDQRASIADYLCELAEEGRRQRRDNRAVLSFYCEVEPERAMKMAKEWIEATSFRNNPALYACHRNTHNLYIHVLVTTRDIEGHKLDLSDREYQSFDKEWAKVYDRELERGADNEHSRRPRESPNNGMLRLLKIITDYWVPGLGNL